MYHTSATKIQFLPQILNRDVLQVKAAALLKGVLSRMSVLFVVFSVPLLRSGVYPRMMFVFTTSRAPALIDVAFTTDVGHSVQPAMTIF